METKINIRELKDSVNYLMFTMFSYDMERLKLSNQVCEKIGGLINESKINSN